MKNGSPLNGSASAPRAKSFWLLAGCLVLILLGLFHSSFWPSQVLFSNDGPLGMQQARFLKLPEGFSGTWYDLQWLGANTGNMGMNITNLVKLVFGPTGFAKFFIPICLLLAGLFAGVFFRAAKLSATACILGALAVTLNGDYFSTACWGLASHPLAVGLIFLALAALQDTTSPHRWLKVVLAGLAVGLNVIEAADIGALFSLVVAAYVCFQAWIGPGSPGSRIARGGMRTALVAVCAVLIAAQTLLALVTVGIKGVAGTQQDAQTRAEKWDWATQWSLPKREALGIVVPGLFGYRMDTPDGGNYWGGIGRDPAIDRHLDSGQRGEPPAGTMRFSGNGYYAGVLVVLVACWAIWQSFRRRNPVFDPTQQRFIQFWTVLAIIALLLSFGRFAPFYQFLYALPYFSTIRNPTKLQHVCQFALIILFAYGVDGLVRRYLGSPTASTRGLVNRFKAWWAKADAVDRRWVWACLVVIGLSAGGWMAFANARPSFERYLQLVQFSPDLAKEIASFSLRQVGWFMLFLLLCVGSLLLVFCGTFAGARAKWAGLLLGAVLIADLGRANLPWIVYWDYHQKYATNPIVDALRDKPHEHRVALLPFRAPPQFSLFEQLYRIEWAQHHFPYYNIQSLDIVQMPRMPLDMLEFEGALRPDGTPATLSRFARRWELTNTRYLLGPAGFLDVLNRELDPERKRFRIANAFEVAPKPGVANATRLEQLTAVPKPGGSYALFEFTGALPRVKLYANWEVSTNDQATLAKLTDATFNPAETVLVAEATGAAPGTNQNAGTVEFTSYAPTRLEFRADVKAPAVLLLNDRYDANWIVTVDGKPAPLLRCNYIMRGVELPTGQHTVEFRFHTPLRASYISLAVMGVGVLLLGWLILSLRRRRVSSTSAGMGA